MRYKLIKFLRDMATGKAYGHHYDGWEAPNGETLEMLRERARERRAEHWITDIENGVMMTEKWVTPDGEGGFYRGVEIVKLVDDSGREIDQTKLVAGLPLEMEA